MIDTYAVKQLLIDLHESYLKDNKYDESNLIYYRINYKLMDAFEMTKEDAENFHIFYHEGNAEGYLKDIALSVRILSQLYQ
jgi:hypothetical protein